MHDYTYLTCPHTTTSKPLSIVPSRPKALAASQEKESEQSCAKVLFLLTAPPLRRTTACTLFCWIAVSLIYYGVSLNAANLRWVLRSNLVFGKYDQGNKNTVGKGDKFMLLQVDNTSPTPAVVAPY